MDKFPGSKTEDLIPPQKKVYQAGVIDLEELKKAQIKDVADSRMTESKEDRSKNWLIRNAKRFWKHNVAQEWYRNREKERVSKEISESGNLYAGESKDVGVKDYEKAKEAILARFISEYEDDMLKQEEKDSKKYVTDEKVKGEIKNLIKQFAGDLTMSDSAFEEESNRVLATSNPEYAEKGKMYANNLLNIAREHRNSVIHDEKLLEMDFDVEITLGQAKESLNTEAKHNTFEKIIEKTQNSKLGKYLFNEPAAVAIAAGLYSAGSFLGVKVLRSKLMKWGTFGATAILAGGISAGKEATRLNRERAQHIRESAKGMEFKENDMKRRKEMEENRYETKNAQEIIQSLEKDLARVEAGNISESELNSIMANLSDVEARIKIGDTEHIDLIAYSRFNKVEEESDKLRSYRAKIKVAIRKGIDDGKIKFEKEETFDKYLQKLINLQSEGINTDMEEKNEIFKTMKRRKVAWAFTKTALLGATAGFVFQEARAFFQDGTDGFFEGIAKHLRGDEEHLASKATAFEGLRRWFTGDGPRVPFGVGHEMMLGNTHVQLPDGVTINQNIDNTYDVLRDGEVISKHVKLEFNPVGNTNPGDLNDASKELLKKDGILTTFAQTGGKVTEHITREAEEYTNKHPELTRQIHRGWMDNDTPMHPDPEHPGHLIGADKNELKLEWGGKNGINENGDYVFQVKHITDDGSYHDGLSVAAHEQMKKGGLEVLLSVTKGTQHMVIPVKINELGEATILHTSDTGKMLFENVNGKAIYDGAFAEVGHSTGLALDGGENMQILATHIGTGSPKDIIEEIIKDTTNANVKLDVPADRDYAVPFPIPVGARRPLERGAYIKKVPDDLDSSRYLYLTGSTEDRKRWEKNRSPRLSKNPDAVLSQKEELEWYFDKQLKERGEVYIKELDSFVEQNRSLKNIRPDTKIAVCMPVAAAQEYENIYNTLSLYSKQDKAAVNKTVIIMNVNWPDDADMNNVQKTIDAIEKAKKDFSNLQIATFTKVWPRKWIDEKEGAIYGEVVKYVNDIALRSINKAGLDNDVYLLTNDADAKGMSKHYLSTYINSTEKNKNKDGFLGKIEWSPELYEKYPGYHLSMRMYQFLESSIRHSSIKKRNVASSGANFLVKAGTFAAIGGYNADMGAGADTDLGRSIKNARFGGRELLPEDKLPINYVNGAWIDTDPSRSFRYYKNGIPIVNQWNDFDSGGYQPRGDVSLLEGENESIENDFDQIIKRSSFQITSLINNWIGFDKKEEYTKALDMGFPPQKDLFGNTIPLWKVEKDDDGHNQVIFTNEGKVWIKKQLKNYKDKNLSDQIYKRGLRSKNRIEKEEKTRVTKKIIKIKPEKEREGKDEKVVAIEAPIETKKSKEIVSSDSIKEIIKDKIGDLAKIEKLNLDFIGDTLKVEGALDAGILGGKIKIKGFLENNGDMIEIRSRDLDIEARGYIKSRINKNLSKLAPEMKKYFEEKYERGIKSIQIEKGQIELTFNE